MPYLADDEEFKKQQEQQAQTAGGSTQFAAGGDVAGPKSGSSGRYANLNKYLEANKPQAQAMGEDIAQSVEAQGQKAQSGIEKVAGAKIEASELQPEKYLTTPESLTGEQKSEYQQFKKTGGYIGPGSVENVSGYEEAIGAGSAGKAAKALETEEGQLATLQQKYARPSYQKGQQTLDQLLLQGEPTSKARMQEVSGRYKGLEDMLGNTLTQKQGEIGAAQQKAQAQRQAIPGIEQKAWENFLNPIQTRAGEKTKEAQDVWGRVNEDIQDNVLSPETMDLLGLKGGEALYDLGLSGFVTPDISQRNVEQVANPQERSRYAALASLFEDPTRQEITASGAELSPVRFNKEEFATAQSRKKNELKGILDESVRQQIPGMGQLFGGGIQTIEDVPKKLDSLENPELIPHVNTGDVEQDSATNATIDDQNRASQIRSQWVKYLRGGGQLPSGEAGYAGLQKLVELENQYKSYLNPRSVMPAGMKDLPKQKGPVITKG